MTRITTFQAAGILVAALMCISEVCYAYNKTTNGAKTTTEVTNNEPPTKTASNMTIESGTTKTALFGILTSEARWQVRDNDGKLCMLMDFDGTITDVNNGETVQIPSDASTSRSDCSSSSHSAFVLDFSTLFTEWGIVMNFTDVEGSFKLRTLSVSRSTSGTPVSSSVTEDFFQVPFGDYYTCSYFKYSLGYFQLSLTNPLLQPFVQKTEGGDNLGQPYSCRLAHSEDSVDSEDDTLGISLGTTIPGILVFIAICCGCYWCCCRTGDGTVLILTQE